jgi:hypothetical protein
MAPSTVTGIIVFMTVIGIIFLKVFTITIK